MGWPPLSLRPLTTMGVGGSARNFVEARNEEDVIEAARSAIERGEELYPLGGGSNVVVSDDGVPGTVVRLRTERIDLSPEGGDKIHVTAAAGENWHRFALEMTEGGYAGLECLGGIPGAVGATPIQNVGAYGQEVSQTITRVRALHRKELNIVEFTKEECQFGYRDSVFKQALKDQFVVLSVTYELTPGGPPLIRCGELSKSFEQEKNETPSLMEVFNRVVELRRKKSMVYDTSDPNHRSCGSFFVNAQIAPREVEKISEIAGSPAPTFPGENGLVKVPSAWLIERAGLSKGAKMGCAGLSTKHTLSIVAHDGATANDVVHFAHHVRDMVMKRFSVDLRPEPHFWGFSDWDGGLPKKAS